MIPIEEIVAIVGGLLLSGFVFWSITSLIRFWINKRYEHKQDKNVDVQKLREFEEFRRSVERRLRNLEAVFVEDEDLDTDEVQKSIERKAKQVSDTIEIEDEKQRSKSTEESSGRTRSSGGRLPNMLEK